MSRPRSRQAELNKSASGWQSMDTKHGGGSLTQMHIASPKGAQDNRFNQEQQALSRSRTSSVPSPMNIREMQPASTSPWEGSGEAENSPLPARPPPAGMRGAFSWGLGPNAYEVDGRPGTRGGGPSMELDGRPGTRSGGNRPPSRMHAGMGQTQSTTSTAAQMYMGSSGHVVGGERAGLGSSGGAGYMQRKTLDAPPPPPPVRAIRAPSAPSPSIEDLGTSQLPSAAARNPRVPGMPSGAPGRNSRQTSSSTGSMQAPKSQGSGKGKPIVPGELKQRQRRETDDIEKLIEALSDAEDSSEESSKGIGSTVLDDLNSYLRTLDQDDLLRGGASKLGKGRGRKPDISGIRASTQQLLQNNSLKYKKTDSIPSHRPEAKGGRPLDMRDAEPDSGLDNLPITPDGSQPPAPEGQRKQSSFTKLPQKAVRMALKIVDSLISEAVKTVEVSKVIKDAEDKAMQEEAAMGGQVLLQGDNWQEAARSLAGEIKDELSDLLSSHKASNTPKSRNGSLAALEPLRVPRPEDDFSHVMKPVSWSEDARKRQSSTSTPMKTPTSSHRSAPALQPLMSPTLSESYPNSSPRSPMVRHSDLSATALSGPAELITAAPGMSRYGIHRLH